MEMIARGIEVEVMVLRVREVSFFGATSSRALSGNSKDPNLCCANMVDYHYPHYCFRQSVRQRYMAPREMPLVATLAPERQAWQGGQRTSRLQTGSKVDSRI
jgi:hypothetical protein